MVNHLSDRLEASETTPERQGILDDHIRIRIHDELQHLRREDEQIRQEIERALERENLDREKAMAGDASNSDGSSAGDIRNSAALLGDMEEIRSKIDKYHSTKKMSDYPEVEASSAALAECYRRVFFLHHFSTAIHFYVTPRKNKDTPLNCWLEVNKFKNAVERLEQVSSAMFFFSIF